MHPTHKCLSTAFKPRDGALDNLGCAEQVVRAVFGPCASAQRWSKARCTEVTMPTIWASSISLSRDG